MADPNFPDLAPFPGEAPGQFGETAGRYHNEPPLEDRVLMDFDEAIRTKGLNQRVADIGEAAERCPPIDNVDVAGQAGDLIAAARAAKEAIEAERETLNRPLLTAQRSLKAKADGFVGPMQAKISDLAARLDDFMDSHPDAVRGDFGARVGIRETWEFKVESWAKLPFSIRRDHPDVVAAIDKAVRALIRGGTRKIAGVRIWSIKKANVR